jgi:hypothetical protein
MTGTPRSIEFKLLYVARFLIEIAGIFMLISSVGFSLVAYSLRNGARGGHPGEAIADAVLSLVTGIGLLLPLLWAKLLASFLLVGEGAWVFFHDSYRWSNSKIFLLLLMPLLLTSWLRAGYRKFNIERLPNANQV